PGVKSDLEEAFSWQIDFRPTIVLVSERERFGQMAGNPLFVAYAVPKEQLIVIDHTRMNIHPFTLRITLKHELCHLLLHRYIPSGRLPKWFDEGVAQWISDGISEILVQNGNRELQWASITGRFLSFSSLTTWFPNDDKGLRLAYEQSRSIVEYIVENYGKNGLHNILQALKNGLAFPEAIETALMIPPKDLEMRWRAEQRSWLVLFSYLSGHLYTILFVLGAIILLAAYVRILIRKRRLEDEEDISPYM
ncbi:MAG: peptidase MA family metallohydrolase, partial [Desulfomonilia bacterium]